MLLLGCGNHQADGFVGFCICKCYSKQYSNSVYIRNQHTMYWYYKYIDRSFDCRKRYNNSSSMDIKWFD